MRRLLVPVLCLISFIACVACGIKGPPLPPENRPADDVSSSEPGTMDVSS